MVDIQRPKISGKTDVNNQQVPARYCVRCNELFKDYENMACTGQDQFWHLNCFVCSQCFRPLNKDFQYYHFNERIYCERDFRTLFAPCCAKCNHYIIGRFIRAVNKCWHPNCFLCEECQIPLADHGFMRHKNRSLCHNCHAIEKEAATNKHICNKCHSYIDESDQLPPLRYKGDTYHSYHFNCNSCGIQLRSDARQVNEDLYCLRCHDQMDFPICGGCRKPIEERVVTALGKHWHAYHFVCTTCEKPFHGKRHFEVKGLAYCVEHYYELFGHRCETCAQIIKTEVICALDKHYCKDHFACYQCGRQLIPNKTKFFDVYTNPCCKKCYRKLPANVRKRLDEERKLEKCKKSLEETQSRRSQLTTSSKQSS